MEQSVHPYLSVLDIQQLDASDHKGRLGHTIGHGSGLGAVGTVYPPHGPSARRGMEFIPGTNELNT